MTQTVELLHHKIGPNQITIRNLLPTFETEEEKEKCTQTSMHSLYRIFSKYKTNE